MAFATAFSLFAFLPPAAPPGRYPRRARAPAVRTGVSAAHRPQARIAWGATPAHVRQWLDEHERQRASRLPARSVLDGPHWGPGPKGANCPRCNPRARALSSCTGASVACRPLARIDSGGTPPRTCTSGSMSTSEASCHERELPGVQPPRIDSPGTPPRQKVLCQAFSKESGWNKEGEMGSDYGYRNA